jgi:hypothetical protein
MKGCASYKDPPNFRKCGVGWGGEGEGVKSILIIAFSSAIKKLSNAQKKYFKPPCAGQYMQQTNFVALHESNYFY